MKDSVIKFFEFVRQDEKLTERLRAVGDKIEDFSRLACELGRERGFMFAAKDVHDTLKTLVSQDQGELTDEQLGAIAGGLYGGLTLIKTAACAGGGGGIYDPGTGGVVGTIGCPTAVCRITP